MQINVSPYPFLALVQKIEDSTSPVFRDSLAQSLVCLEFHNLIVPILRYAPFPHRAVILYVSCRHFGSCCVRAYWYLTMCDDWD